MSTKESMSSAGRQFQEIVKHFTTSYRKETPTHIQLIDYFLVYAVATGVAQFLYLLLVGQFPYNSFLSGFIAAVGFFIFTVCLRLQVSYPHEFGGISRERAYADYVVCNLILFFVVITFMG